MALRSVLALASAITLSGCSLFHSNINGAFACAAPRGTCAPSMAIDDAALRAIGPSSGDQAEDATMPASVAGAGSAQLIHARKRASRSDDSREPLPGARPALKVVYPAWRGPDGRVHEQTTAYTPIDMPATAAAALQPVAANTMGAPDTSNLLAVAELAPDADALTAPMPGTQVSADAPWHDNSPKPASAPAAAGPMDAIKQQVSQILSSLPKPGPTKSPNTAAPKPDASLSPAGN